MSIGSYSKIYQIGHRATAPLFQGPVTIEEKVDGSQFSFGIDDDGRLHARSKRCTYDLDSGVWDTMFEEGCQTVLSLRHRLVPGWAYRGEYLKKPKHNALKYDRIPDGHIVLYDIDTGNQDYLEYGEKASAASELGLEVIPLLAIGEFNDWESLKALLERESFLGGAPIEGFVVKNYSLFDQTSGKTLMGKYVSEAFKEVHQGEWKKANPGRQDIVIGLISSLRTEARWRKAVEYLRDAGELENDPRDIGKIIRQAQEDIKAEERDYIANTLYDHFERQILKGAVGGLPEWYKDLIAVEVFDAE